MSMQPNLFTLFAYAAMALHAAPPVPGQETGTPGDSADKTEQKANAHKKAATSPLTVKPTAKSITTNESTDPIAGQDKKNTENLTKITAWPVISIADRNKTFLDYVFDWGPWFFSLCLVIVGVLGVRWAKKTFAEIEKQATRMKEQVDRMDTQVADARAAVAANALTSASTLAAIEKQATLMERQAVTAEESVAVAKDNAAAALLNAQASFNAERPWFVASMERRSEDSNEWRVRITNKGRTPGHLAHVSAEYTRTHNPSELPLPPNYSGLAWMPDSMLFAAGDAFTARQWMDEWFDAKKIWENVRSSETDFLAIYGRVRYRDTLTGWTDKEIMHETRWCYHYVPPTGKFVPSGPAEYNGYRDHQKGEQKAN
jgi:uncharacterized membrane protein